MPASVSPQVAAACGPHLADVPVREYMLDAVHMLMYVHSGKNTTQEFGRRHNGVCLFELLCGVFSAYLAVASACLSVFCYCFSVPVSSCPCLCLFLLFEMQSAVRLLSTSREGQG